MSRPTRSSTRLHEPSDRLLLRPKGLTVKVPSYAWLLLRSRRMARVLVTGMSGVGKTSVLEELGRRGWLTVDTDYDGWVLADGRWDERRMDQLLADEPDVVVSGTVENQGRFYDRFEQVVLISAPVEVLIERVSTRTNNPYGRTAEEQAEIAAYVETVEPLLRSGATVELDGRRPAGELADVIEGLQR